jgi:hypothetical protein
MQRKLLEAVAKWEVELPLSLATVVQHFLVHVLAPKTENGLVLNNGPSNVTGMMAAERMNKTIKSLTKATHGVLEGLARSYGLLLAMELQDIAANPGLFDGMPTYLTRSITVQLVDPRLQRGGLPAMDIVEGSDLYNFITSRWEWADQGFRAARAVRRSAAGGFFSPSHHPGMTVPPPKSPRVHSS